jgi:ABC-type nitrate/sulfonate/bicarbonate transport system substrate-binding protein
MKKIIILGCVVLAAAGGFFAYNTGVSTKPKTIEKLTLAIVDQPTFALIYIAQYKGYFKDEGLDITFRNFNAGKEAIADVLSGGSDIATSYESPFARAIYDGNDLSIISTLHTSTKNIALVGRRDRGINSINDIKNKRIAVTVGSSHEFFLTSYLTSQGIKLSDVTLVNTPFKDIPALLREGKVDGAVDENPYLYDIKNEFSPNEIVIFESDTYTTNSVISGKTSVIKEKGEAMTRLLRALARAETLLKNNQDEAINAVTASLPHLSSATIRATWDQFTPVLKLDNVLLSLLESEAQWFKDNGVYQSAVPNYRSTIFTDYLKKVKPDSVTVY